MEGRIRIALLAACACAAPLSAGDAQPPCAAADGIEAGPRLAHWIEQRKAKCSELSAYSPAFLERQFRGFAKAERPALLELNLLGLYPRVQTIEHRSLWAAGMRLWKPDLLGSRFSVNGSSFWSLQGFQYHELQLGVVPHHGKAFPLLATKADDVFELANVRGDSDTPYMLYGSFSYRWAPKFDFFGLGPDSRSQDQADFRLQDSLYELVAGYRVLPRLSLLARAGYYDVELGPGEDEDLPPIQDVFPPAAVPGLAAQPAFLRYGAAAVFDSRDVPRNPHRGAVIAFEWQRYDARHGAPGGFDRFGADARAFLALGHPQRVLALRAYVSKDDPAGVAPVPFYLQAYLGGSHTLRAYANQRFRGEKLALLQAEYRWEASPALELAAFVDSGTVATTAEDALGGFKIDGGVSVRFKSHEAVLLRVDSAWGREGFRLRIRFNPAF